MAKILIIDDSRLNGSILKDVLKANGYEAEWIATGLGGLDLLKNGDFDLVILDLVLPEMDGFAVLASIRGDEKIAHLPVFVLTSRESADELNNAMALGATFCATKHKCPIPEVIGIVKNLLAKKKSA